MKQIQFYTFWNNIDLLKLINFHTKHLSYMIIDSPMFPISKCKIWGNFSMHFLDDDQGPKSEPFHQAITVAN